MRERGEREDIQNKRGEQKRRGNRKGGKGGREGESERKRKL